MNRQYRRGIALSGALLALGVLSFSDTARAQSVTATPSVLNFTTAPGIVATGCNGNATCTVHVTGTGVSTAQIQTSASWIKVNPSFAIASLPGDMSVSVDPSTLNVGGTSGTITIYSPTNSAINTLITVNATVSTTASALAAAPTSLSFEGQSGATFGTPQNCAIQNSPSSCQITITSNAGPLTYNITPSTTDGHAWLQPDRTSGQTSGSPVNVAVNPSAVPGPGTYTGSILFQSTTTNDAVAVSVTMNVSANPTLTATPTQLAFFYTLGTSAPAQQQITVASSSNTLSFNVTQSSNSSWLTVSPISGAASSASPATLNVNVSPNSPVALTAGKYTAQIFVTPVGGGAAQSVNVSLIVSASPFLTVSKNQLTFSAPFGGSAPGSQAVVVGSTGGALNFNTSVSSDSGWMFVTPNSGVTGAPTGTLSIGVNPAVLAALSVGTYNGTLTITPSNGDPYSLSVSATLTVGASSQVTAAPQGLYFSYQIGQTTPPAQTIALNSSGPAVAFSIATALSGANPSSCGASAWLSATAQTSPLTTPNLLTVTVNTSGMTSGTCIGTVKVTYASSSGNAELDVPVTLFVSNNALLNISVPQAFGIESTTLNGANINRQVSLTSTDGSTAISYSVSFQSAPCAWLFAAPLTGGNTGTTPTPLQINILPGCITSPGTYQGSVTLTSANLPQPATLPITLFVTSNVQIAVTPQALTFTQSQNGPLPAAQNLNFTVTGGNANFIATATTDLGNWLQVNPTSGSTSLASVSVSILANSLPPSATPYNGRITLTFQNAATPSAIIPVKYTVNPPQSLTVSPTSLTFAYQIAGPNPANQQLNISSTGGTVAFTIGTTSNGGWLGVDTASSSTPANGNPKVINVSIDPTKFPSGTGAGNSLQGTITVSAPGVLATPATVNVTLNITAAAVPQPSTVSTSAVSNGFGAIAPGELIAIKGTNLGPASPANGSVFKVNAQGGVDSTLAGVQVTFDGIPGTPTFVSATQINVIVPWEIAGRTNTSMVISFNSGNSAPLPLSVTSAAPGIYTQNATGAGQAAAINLSPTAASPYNGPLGSTYPGTSLALAPAPQGSFVSFYLTGCGKTNPASATGTINSGTTLMPLLNWAPGSSVVTASIGGQPATVQFAGAAPTLITGVCQVNLQVPQGVSGNALAVKITINGLDTLGSATVAVQ